MMFDPKTYELRQWTITDAQGKDTTVMIFNVQQGVKFGRVLQDRLRQGRRLDRHPEEPLSRGRAGSRH